MYELLTQMKGGGGSDFEDNLTYDLITILNYTHFVGE
jgi:hypothetical protein